MVSCQSIKPHGSLLFTALGLFRSAAPCHHATGFVSRCHWAKELQWTYVWSKQPLSAAAPRESELHKKGRRTTGRRRRPFLQAVPTLQHCALSSCAPLPLTPALPGGPPVGDPEPVVSFLLRATKGVPRKGA